MTSNAIGKDSGNLSTSVTKVSVSCVIQTIGESAFSFQTAFFLKCFQVKAQVFYDLLYNADVYTGGIGFVI